MLISFNLTSATSNLVKFITESNLLILNRLELRFGLGRGAALLKLQALKGRPQAFFKVATDLGDR